MLTFKKVEIEKKIPANQVLLSQEKKNPIIFILHSGKVDCFYKIKINDKEYSINFFEINKEQYFGYESFIPNMRDLQLITREETILSLFPLNDFKEIINYKLDLFPILMKDLFYKIKKYNLLLNELITLANNLHQANRRLAKILSRFKIPIPQDSQLEPYFDNPITNFAFNFDTVKNFFMVEENQRKKYREFVLKNDLLINDFLDYDVIDSFMKIIKVKKKIANALFEIHFDEMDKYHLFIEKNFKNLVDEFDVFFTSENSLLKLIKKNEKKINSKDRDFFFSLMNFLSREIFENKIINNINFDKSYEKYLVLEIEEVKNLLNQQEEKNQKKLSETSLENNSSRSEVDIIKIYEDNYKKLEIEENIIREIKKYNYEYIQYCKNIYRKKIKEPLNPEEEDFSTYGIYENLLEENQIKALRQIVDDNFDNETKYDIVSFSDWMESIIDGTNAPSNNDLAISYRKHLLNLSRFKKKILNPVEDKVNYEIDNAFMSIVQAFNKEPMNIYPLNKFNFPNDLKEQIINSKKIENLLDEIKGKDFSLFFRETLFKYRNKNHILQYEVLPKFIIIPVIAPRIVFWQEMVDNKKKTQARFFLPLFYSGSDLKKELINNLAAYRWEICRSVKGASWMDPIDGALTGAFNDYMTFYKKNLSLSSEQKEKLYNMKNKYRDNKRLFMHMYYLWLEFESKGLIRLNEVEREMFCKQIPFKKNIRDNLRNAPLFQNYIDRYNNINKNEYDIIIRRFRDYKKPNSNELLDEVQDHIDYYIS